MMIGDAGRGLALHGPVLRFIRKLKTALHI